MNTLIEVATAITGVLPNPEPEQPPGTEGVSTLINWLAWGALIPVSYTHLTLPTKA